MMQIKNLSDNIWTAQVPVMAHIDSRVHETKPRMGSCNAALNNTENRLSLLVIQEMSNNCQKVPQSQEQSNFLSKAVLWKTEKWVV